MNILQQQYGLIKSSREVVLNFCETLLPGHYTAQVENFGKGGTIRHLHVHTANTYLYWLQDFAQNKKPVFFNPDEITTVAGMRAAFEKVNSAVEEFLAMFEGRYDEKITNTVTLIKQPMSLEPLTVFSHTITHEFHHKGQVMSMARILGYTPVDADLIRP